MTCPLNSTNDWYVNVDNIDSQRCYIYRSKQGFDTLDHGILLAKLHHFGINGIEHDWIRSYLNNRKQFCKIQSTEAGVSQGSCLGPLLFFLYINDSTFALCEAHATMYADNMENLVAVANSELSRFNR